MGEGADIGLLHGILSLGIVAQNAAGDAEQPLVIAADQSADGILVAGPDPGDQRGIGGGIRLCLGRRHGVAQALLFCSKLGCSRTAEVPGFLTATLVPSNALGGAGATAFTPRSC